MVVQYRGQQIVGQLNGVEIAGEMQVDVFHRDNLRIAAAGGAALHAEYRAETRFAQCDDRLLANAVERIAQAHRCGRLAFASRSGTDRGDEDQLAIRPAFQTVQILQRYLGLIVAVGFELLIRNAQAIPRQCVDAFECRLLGDVDV